MANKTTNKESTIPLPIVVLLFLVVVGAGLGGLSHRQTTNRRGHFEITFEWHLIPGGVTPKIFRNDAPYFAEPVRLTRDTGKKTYPLNGRESDHVVASLKGLREFTADTQSSMFVSILFVPADGSPSPLPEFSRDASPSQAGVIARWP